MDVDLINRLIRFHKYGLQQYRHYISPAAQYSEEQTIKALEELKRRLEADELERKNEDVKDVQNG